MSGRPKGSRNQSGEALRLAVLKGFVGRDGLLSAVADILDRAPAAMMVGLARSLPRRPETSLARGVVLEDFDMDVARVCAALWDAEGELLLAADRLGVRRHELKAFVVAHEPCAQAWQDARENREQGLRDLGERALCEALRAREPWAVKLMAEKYGLPRNVLVPADVLQAVKDGDGVEIGIKARPVGGRSVPSAPVIRLTLAPEEPTPYFEPFFRR